jgi:uncharacterized protein YbaP (TraB family)
MRFIYFFLTVFIGGHCSAESSVWRVESADSIIYLGGTCHMLRASDWPLPAAYDFAYRQSEIMVFETNLERMEATDFQAQLLQRVQLPNGSTLQSVLSPHVYQELLDYCNANQLPIAVLQRLKPSFAMLSLALLEYQKLGVTQEGVDHYYLKRAHKDAKSVRFFETIEEQLDLLCSIGDGNEDAFVSYTLDEMESASEVIQQILVYWRSGNRAELNALINEEMRTASLVIYQRMLVDRNKKWMPTILEYFKTAAVEYVLVGAAHLVGEDGLLQQLEQRGYIVTKVHAHP